MLTTKTVDYSPRDLAWLRILLLALVSFAYLLFVSEATSPLYDSDGIDSLVFRMVALKWLNGYIPYAETFDHKGPYLYIINMLGILINKQYGILILQTINLTIFLEVTYRIGKLYRLTRIKICLSLGLMLLVALGFFQEGDMTEEWSLVFVTFPLYLFLRFLGSPGAKTPDMRTHRPIWSFLYGVCFGIVALIRINNTSIICAVVIVVAFMCIKQRRWYSLAVNALAALGGVTLAVAPIFIYFAVRHAFSEMIYGVFGFNLHYSKIWTLINGCNLHALMYANFFKMLWLVCLGGMVVASSIQNRRFTVWGAVILSASIITFLTILTGMGFLHYLMMMMPLCFVLFCFVMTLKWDLCLAVVTLMLVPGSDMFKYTFMGLDELRHQLCTSDYDTYYGGTDYLLDTYVPEHDLDDVYMYNRAANLAPMWRRGVVLKQRILTGHENYPKVDEKIRDWIIEDLINRNPRWIITHEVFATPANPLFLHKIHTEYMLVDSINEIKLFKLR